MKRFLMPVAMFLMVAPVGAETYSWVDEKGTYSFSDDLSSVPKKYRKKAKRIGDAANEPATQQPAPAAAEKKPEAGQSPASTKAVSATGEDKQLYNGKSRDLWRQEFDAHESELKTLEQRLDEMQKQSKKASVEQFTILKKDYDDARALYLQKYKVYTELIESARKAGLTVEIKK